MNTYNMKFHAWFREVLGLFLVAFIASCDDSDLIRRVEPTLEIQDELSMGPVASRQVIDLHSSYPWFAEASASWIKLKRYRGQALLPDSIVAEIEENPEMALREGWIEIRLMDQMSKRIVVKQNGRGSLITLSKEVLYFNINGGEAVLDVVTDLEWNVEEEQIGGFTFKKVDDTHLKVKVAKNTTGAEIRKSVILSDTGKTTETKLTIVQTNVEKMLSISLSETEKNMITDKKGMQFNIPVSLNIQFDCKVSHSWIHVGELPEFSGDIVQDVNIPIELDANDGFEDRTGYIVVKNQGDVVEVSDTLYVTQRLYSQIVYVKAGANGDGSSWERAFGTIEEGLSACAHYGDMQMWVAAGDYYLKDWIEFKKVNFYGGFEGKETTVSERTMKRKSILHAASSNVWPSVYMYKLTEGATRVVDGFEFVDSKGKKGEGALVAYEYWMIRNCVVRNNTCARDAGGAYFLCTLINCVIRDNETLSTSSTMNVQQSTCLYNVTVVNNRSAGSSAGVRLGSGTCQMVNCVVWGNVHTKGDLHSGYLDQNKAAIFKNCAIQGGWIYNGGNTPQVSNCINLNTDNAATDGPQFADVAGKNYQPTENSPLVDAGLNSVVKDWNLLLDIQGDARISNAGIDIGAFEWQANK